MGGLMGMMGQGGQLGCLVMGSVHETHSCLFFHYHVLLFFWPCTRAQILHEEGMHVCHTAHPRGLVSFQRY
jgi:hypothetical protein